MGFAELLMVGVALSMDACAASICKGLGMRRVNWRHAAVIAAFFGGFQALMPLIGWALGTQFEQFITPVDHWIAFALLVFLGGKMLWDAFHEGDGEASVPVESRDASDAPADERLDLRELLVLAVATSIDALAMGITFAFLKVNILSAVAVIGVATFAFSFAGVAVGSCFGARFRRPATIAGGVVLIAIGVKILLEHLGVLAF